MTSKKIKFSVSTNFLDKNPLVERAFEHGFQEIEGTIDDLASVVHDDGWTFGYVFQNGRRSKSNFISSDFLAIDIDHGLKIEQAFENPIVQNYCSLFYTTPRHTLDDHHFRLVFLLPRPITNAVELTAATRSLCRRLGGDMAATDAARVFHGHKGCEPLIFEKEISDGFLKELIKDGEVIITNQSISNTWTTANQSSLQFKPDLTIRTRDGSWIQVGQVTNNTTIYCPYHNDHSPSAFVQVNKRGTYIHCSSCKLTWWMEGVQPYGFDFYGFEREIQKIKNAKSRQAVETPFGDFIDVMRGVKIPNLEVTETEKVELTAVESGITFVKSPKGSGKTTYLTRVTNVPISLFNSLEQYEEEVDYEVEVPFSRNETVLLIGHRRALIGELCQRIGLNCYLDDDKYSPDEVDIRRRQYGICLDSLAKVRFRDYDVILIDEVEQVIAHFMSSTVGDKREDLFRLFSRQIHSAKKVVALDADIGWISFITLTVLTQPRLPKRPKKGALAARPKPVHIYINNRKSSGSTLNLYSSLNQLIKKIAESAVEGKRVFVASNSKEKIKTLEHGLKNVFKDINQEIPMMAISSDNSRDDDVQEFIKNIKKDILNYKVILSSPSLGTGVDITFDNDAKEIDCVFGIFENRINSHFEIDQQLSRVRHPKEVHVWISPQTFNFETEFNVVKTDYMYDRLIDVMDEGSVTNSDEIYPGEINPFYQLAAMVMATERASKNRLKTNFLEYKIRQGWTIVPVEKDEDLIDQGKEIRKFGEFVKQAIYVENVVNARTLNQREFSDVIRRLDWDDGPVSEDEWYSMVRTRIELFYGEQVTNQLVVDDNDGMLRRQVYLYGRIQTTGQVMKETDIEQSPKNKLFRSPKVAAQLLHLLLSKTPVYSNGKFNPNVVYTRDDLNDFIVESKRLNMYVQTHLEVDLRSDIDEKPVTHLSSLLKTIGLVVFQPKKPTVSNGHKTYYYGVSSESIKKIEEIIEKRNDPQGYGWNFVNKLYGFQYSPDEMDQIIEIGY